jgi:predicted MPP superfamily phosphohydrolase
MHCKACASQAVFGERPPGANSFATHEKENYLSVGPLNIGLNKALHVREERLSIRSDACRLMYVSDIHLRRKRSDHLCRQVLESVRCSQIDALLLGGDLVDRGTELGKLCDLVGALCEFAPVLAVGGNHDRNVGLDRVRDAVVGGGGQWIHASSTRISHGCRVIAVSGPDASSFLHGDFQVLCAHNPRIWKMTRGRGFDLVLAGHLHGCQVVAFEYRDRLFPGAIFYPYCYLNHRIGSTRLVVSRGVSDLVPIRWRCPREVVLCHV